MLSEKHSKKYNNKCFLVFSLLIVFLWGFEDIFAENVSNYERELEEIKLKQKENTVMLTGIDKEFALYSYEIANYDSQMLNYSKKSAQFQYEIENINEKLKELEKSSINLNNEYIEYADIYEKRLRNIYENGMPSKLDIYLNSESLSQFFLKLEIYNKLIENDKNIVNNFKTKKEYLEYTKKDMRIQKMQLENLKKENEASIVALKLTLETKEKRIKELRDTEINLNQNIELLTQKRKEALSKINDEIINIDSSNTSFDSKEFTWPVSGYTNITTSFGEIYTLLNPAGSSHTGVDISGENIIQEPILAIESGKVVTVAYSNYGYGNYVIIDHGKCLRDNNDYVSLYGHCSSLTVESGDIVKKGQIIGYVGSTGNSTGPHLHFEIHINGLATNPLILYPEIKFNF